jgi:hypothetical protein
MELKMIKTVLFLAALLAPALALGADPTANLSVQVVPSAPPGDIQVVQKKMSTLYPQYPNLASSYPWTLSQPITVGHSVFGSALYENNKGNGTSGGNLDTVYVGSQHAIIDDDQGWCCGQRMVIFHAFNVDNPAPTITVSSSSGRNFINETTQFVEIAGLPSSASLDAAAVQFMHLPAGRPLTSPPVTPSAPGDFLYGAAFDYDFGEPLLGPGPGWTIISTCATTPGCGNQAEFDPAQEYQVYNRQCFRLPIHLGFFRWLVKATAQLDAGSPPSGTAGPAVSRRLA